MQNTMIIAGIEFVAGSFKKVSNRSGLAYWTLTFAEIDVNGETVSVAEFVYTNRRGESRPAKFAEIVKLVDNGYVTPRVASQPVTEVIAEESDDALTLMELAASEDGIPVEFAEWNVADRDDDAIGAEIAAGIA